MDPVSLAAIAAGALSASAVVAFAIATAQAAHRPRVLCLMYHRVAPRDAWQRTQGTERVYTLPEDAFDAQLGHLVSEGWHFLSPDDVVAFASGERALTGRSVLLSVDDGCVSGHRSILPLLRRHGARATFFVTTDPGSAIFRLGEGERRMTDGELRELAAAGCTIGSHALSHRPLSALDEAEIRRELTESKRALEQVLGRPVAHFAVPANWYDARVLRLAHEVGYRAVWCSRPDSVRPGPRAFPLPRVNVEGPGDLAAFRRAISPPGIAARRLVLALRGLPKRVVGPRVWTALRGRMLRGAAGRWLSPRRMAGALAGLVGAGLAGSLLWWFVRG